MQFLFTKNSTIYSQHPKLELVSVSDDQLQFHFQTTSKIRTYCQPRPFKIKKKIKYITVKASIRFRLIWISDIENCQKTSFFEKKCSDFGIFLILDVQISAFHCTFIRKDASTNPCTTLHYQHLRQPDHPSIDNPSMRRQS